LKIGILGIQGAYAAHAAILRKLQLQAVTVLYPEDLEQIEALIIPGGESTVLTKFFGFRLHYEDIRAFAERKPVFGTCAGLILMGHGVEDTRVRQLNILDVSVIRNAYGRQTESFETEVTGSLNPPFQAVFIRAPRIRSVGPDIRVLASLEGQPVWVENDKHMACAFHPELTGDTRIHAYFIEKIRKNHGIPVTEHH